jgi:hypothetical protein
MKQFILLSLLALSLTGYSQTNTGKTMKKKTPATCTDGCGEAKPQKTITCKLTTPELQKRKATTIANLKQKILQRKELSNGYAYQFTGTDAVVDELTIFVKTERLCCDFFNFTLTVKGDGTAAWLNITGPKGAKEFITSEIGL